MSGSVALDTPLPDLPSDLSATLDAGREKTDRRRTAVAFGLSIALHAAVLLGSCGMAVHAMAPVVAARPQVLQVVLAPAPVQQTPSPMPSVKPIVNAPLAHRQASTHAAAVVQHHVVRASSVLQATEPSPVQVPPAPGVAVKTAEGVAHPLDVGTLLQQAHDAAHESAGASVATGREPTVSANTHDLRYQFYVDAWRQKVERIGELNYPHAAQDHGGELVMDVALLPDGSVKSTHVTQTSGNPELDAEAQQIVQIAAPYAKFPDALKQNVDVLHITRTWRFVSHPE